MSIGYNPFDEDFSIEEFQEYRTMAYSLREENLRLKKRIDELKSDKEILQKLIDKRESDTAREIFARFKRNTHQGVDGGGFFVEITLRLEDLNWIKERYGVEVEL